MDGFRNRPAVKFCVPFIAGIILGWHADVHWAVALAVAFLILILWQLFLFFGLRKLSLLASNVLIVSFGLVKIGYDAKFFPDNDVARYVVPGRVIQIEGIVSDPARLTPYSLRWTLDAGKIIDRGREYFVSGSVVVTVRRKDADSTLLDSISYGRIVKLRGELQAPAAPRNPGDFDLRHFYNLNGIRAVFIAERFDRSAISPTVMNSFLGSFIYPVRKSITERLDRLIGGDESDFLKGLIVGERTRIPQEVKTSFVNAGVMHILAVSGLHVAIVVMMLLIFLRLFRIPERPSILLTMLCLAYYTFLTGGTASVARSAIMASVFLGARLIERRSDMYNTLALSAMAILLIDARQLFQAGFQLSFVAVFSLVYLYPKFYALFTERLPDFLTTRLVPRFLLQALAVSLAAGIGTLPFTSWYFGKISLVSVVANIVIVPLSNIVLSLGMLSVAFSFVSVWLATVYAAVTSLLTQCMVKAVGFFGSLPFAFLGSHFTTWSSMTFYGCVCFLMGLSRRDRRVRMLITGLVVANCILLLGIFRPSEPQKLRVTFLDVGQGDAAFIEFPDGGTMLVDGGPRTATIDAGERFILPFLRWRGINRIDAIVISHPHSDHLGGIPALLRNVGVGKVYDAHSVVQSALNQEYLRLVDSLHLQRDTLRAGMMLAIGREARTYVLHPTRAFVSNEKRANLNNQSVVLRIVYGRCSLLLSGDAEADAEEGIRNHYGTFLRSNVLKVGHHGSTTSTTNEYMEFVHPSIGVISVGVKNKFHHPSPFVLRRLVDEGAKCFRTDELGAVVVETNGNAWTVVDWR